MRLFQIDYKKLVVLLLPTMVRKPIAIVMLQCATKGIRLKHSEFTSNRDDNLYRLKHTGQVCYLRAVLNDAFPFRSRNFEIEDISATSEWVYALSEIEFPYDQLKVTSEESEDRLQVWSEDYVLIETTPFCVKCPPEVFSNVDYMNRVRHLVNMYKLLSKRAVYESF